MMRAETRTVMVPARIDRRRVARGLLLAVPLVFLDVFFNYAVVVLIVGGLWSHLDPRQEDAARVLGAGRWQTFRAVTLPALRPAIAAAAAIVFLFTFTSFGVILILGGPACSTLETEIYRQTVQFLTLPHAAPLSIVPLAAVVAVVLVAGPRRRAEPAPGLDTLLLLPLGVSAVTIGFGFLVALDRPPFDLRGSPALIPIAHALVAAPFVARVMIPVLRSIDERLREAAAVLGAPPGRVWREIDLPIVARAMLVAAGFAFAISLGEFGATIFIARPDYPTLPVVIFRLLGRPGPLNFGAAMAASVILMAVTAVAIFAIECFRFDDICEF